MAVFDGSNALITIIGNTTTASNQIRLVARNNEIWLRVYGDSLTIGYRQGASGDPLYISIDGGAFSQLIGVTTVTGAGGATSGNLISGETDDWHDIVIRVASAYRENFWLVDVGGVTITSSGGTGDLAAHSECGQFEAVRGTHGTSYWWDNYSDDNDASAAGYSSPIFPGSKPSTATLHHHEHSVVFKVDASTTAIRPVVAFSSHYWVAVWVDGKQIYKYHCTSAMSATVGSLEESIPIPGSGVREVRLVNATAIYGVITDGGFPESAVTAPTTTIAVMGDSVTSSDAVTYDTYTTTWHMLGSVIRGDFSFINIGLSGDTAVASDTANRVTNDVVPYDPDIVVVNYGINDASRWNSVPATVQAEYESLLNSILLNTTADVVVVPPVEVTTGFYADVVAGLQAAVAAVADSRCTFFPSSGWTCDDLREGSHPNTLGYGLAWGLGVVEFLGQPSDGDTVTCDGTTYEFESGGGVSGGNVSVTIGGSTAATVQNLSTAMEGQGTTVRIEHVVLSGAGNLGLVMDVASALSAIGTNLDAYYDGDGWYEVYSDMLDTAAYQNLMLLGVG